MFLHCTLHQCVPCLLSSSFSHHLVMYVDQAHEEEERASLLMHETCMRSSTNFRWDNLTWWDFGAGADAGTLAFQLNIHVMTNTTTDHVQYSNTFFHHLPHDCSSLEFSSKSIIKSCHKHTLLSSGASSSALPTAKDWGLQATPGMAII
jgi:hypothetical protein